MAGRPESRLWGRTSRAPVALATLANATATHHLELDDSFSGGASVHPGISVIPAALAASETTGASGKDLILAIVLGYEVCTRTGLSVSPGVRSHGIHGPGMIGALGTAAAVAKLLGLTAGQTVEALAIAGSLMPVAPFESFTAGARTKDLYGGWGAMLGVMAAEMAKRGLDGPHRLLECGKSVGKLLLHQEGTDWRNFVTDLGNHFSIEDIVFKPFAACRSVQPAVTGVLELMERRPFHPDQVKGIEIETYPFSAELSDATTLRTPISAKLSIPYSVAVAVCTGALGHDAFHPESLRREEYLSLATRIKVTANAQYGNDAFGIRGSVIRVSLNNGETLCHEVFHSRWDPQSPPSDSELEAKLHQLAQGVLPRSRAETLVNLIWRLDQADRAAEIVDWLGE